MIYRAPEGVFRQGDIFDGVPVVGPVALPLTTLGKPGPQKGGVLVRQIFGAGSGRPLPPAIADGRERGDVSVPVRLERALLLSRGCDIENARLVQLAPMRPLATIGDDAARIAVVEGRAKSCHFVPAEPAFGIAPSFVDFRQITSLRIEQLDSLPRVAGLTRQAVALLYLALLRHLTGMDVRLQGTCGTCGAVVPLLSQLTETLDPPADY